MKEYCVVGKPLHKVDSLEKVTGKAIYTDDLKFSGMLTGKILRSPYPHARVLNIDISRAQKLSGVKAVITSKDIGDRKMGVAASNRPIWDQPALCLDKVRYIGDEVAAVAAVNEDTAMEALELIRVDYKELPPVFDPFESLEPGAPLIHDEFERNISNQVLTESGDVEQGFRESYRVFEHRYETRYQAHCAMEPHSSIGVWGLDGRVTLYTSTQNPYNVRSILAYVLGLAEEKVRLIIPKVGGGFGGKAELFPLDVCCVALSRKTGRPVKIVLSREEEFGTTRVSHPIIFDMKTGVMRDGTLVAKQVKCIMDGGAYSGSGLPGPFLSTLFLGIDYKVPNISLNSIRVYTNKTVAGARRGYTAPQAHFAENMHMDLIARELGMDPVQLRLKNAVTTGYRTGTGMDITSCGFTEAIEKAAMCIGWKDKRGKLNKLDKGVGMGSGGSLSGGSRAANITPANYTAAAMIKLHTEGFATLYSGAQDIGQGSDTVMAMMAAEELGIDMDKIRIVSGDTDICPYSAGSASQRITFHSGMATKRAAVDAKDRLFEAVAKRLEARIDDLEAGDNRIYIKGSPDKGMTFREAIWASQEDNKGKEVVGYGIWRHEVDAAEIKAIFETGKGNYAPAYIFSAGTAEVKVDRETGQVDVENFCFAMDVGKPVNPVMVEGQLEGGLHMGIGYSLFEDLNMENGLILNPSFLGYHMPTAFEMPQTDIIVVETDEPNAPFGAKACGEGSVAPVGPAIANAIFDAVGVNINSLPISAEKILKALEEKNKIT
ncbi:MAG: xanthine dehydrogenase family protein molybdopterin-binding subunit [Pseudomonadota bacterium]